MREVASQDGILAAWAVGEGIIIYRIIAREHRAPVPGELLGSSGAFVLLGLLGTFQPALAVSLAVGLDMAAFLNLAGSGVIGTALSGPSSVAHAPAASTPTTPATTPAPTRARPIAQGGQSFLSRLGSLGGQTTRSV